MGSLHVEDNIEENIEKLESMKTVLDDSYSNMKVIQEEVQDMKWTGQSQQHFLLMAEIILDYHQSLIEANASIIKSLKKLEEDVNNYDTSIAVKRLRDIK